MEHVFLSYSRQDEDWARSLKDALADGGVDVWLAGDELRVGDRLTDRISEAMRGASAIILMIGSEPGHWARNEWGLALRASWENERSPTLVPVVLGDAEPPAFVRDRPFLRIEDAESGWDPVVRWLESPPQFVSHASEASKLQFAERLARIKEFAATLPDEPMRAS